MKHDVLIDHIIIPEHEIEITASRAGGPGGQHVNKSSTRVTVRWNIRNTSVLTDEQKALVMQNLQSRITSDGDLIVHSSASRSQQQNKEHALELLAQLVRRGLFVPKKRKKTKISQQAKERRLQEKSRRGEIKRMRKGDWE